MVEFEIFTTELTLGLGFYFPHTSIFYLPSEETVASEPISDHPFLATWHVVFLQGYECAVFRLRDDDESLILRPSELSELGASEYRFWIMQPSFF